MGLLQEDGYDVGGIEKQWPVTSGQWSVRKNGRVEDEKTGERESNGEWLVISEGRTEGGAV